MFSHGNISGLIGVERGLKLATVGLLAFQAIYWSYAMWLGMRQADDFRGYQWMAAFFAMPGFLAFTVPGLLLCLTGVARAFTFVWACLGQLIVPVALWSMLLPALLDLLPRP
jgi:hypothetical protein